MDVILKYLIETKWTMIHLFLAYKDGPNPKKNWLKHRYTHGYISYETYR